MPAKRPPFKVPDEAVIAQFVRIVGDQHALRDADSQVRYLREWRDRFRGNTPVVLRPGSTAEVSEILALACRETIAVVTQAGNTGLVGGQIPSEAGNEIVLSVERLDKIRDVDSDAGTLVVEAGVTLAEVQRRAEAAGWFFPLSLASEGSARIGGVLATNAGGTGVLAYGNARQLTLGVEAVLADGRVWHGLRRLKKDNTGYDLRDLLIGSEGTLAVLTAACLKLHPKPVQIASAVVGVKDAQALLQLYRLAGAKAGQALTAFEFWCRTVEDFALRALPSLRRPLQSQAPWSALIEVSSGGDDGEASEALRRLLVEAMEKGLVGDTALAASGPQAETFWQLRDVFSEAQKIAGGSIKHDISLPLARLPDFLDAAGPIVEAIAPGARPVPFGHFGDGNVHYNVSQPPDMDKAAFLDLWQPMTRRIHDLVSEMGGSFSAEHGIGRMKRDELARLRPAVELDMMRAIKFALDPKGILNPGKVI